jgi:Mn2+/Fe2+ NRAMP family transporter
MLIVSIHNKFNRFLKILGPGLITGAADDDPSGIATYLITGAAFGYMPLWSRPLRYFGWAAAAIMTAASIAMFVTMYNG